MSCSPNENSQSGSFANIKMRDKPHSSEQCFYIQRVSRELTVNWFSISLFAFLQLSNFKIMVSGLRGKIPLHYFQRTWCLPFQKREQFFRQDYILLNTKNNILMKIQNFILMSVTVAMVDLDLFRRELDWCSIQKGFYFCFP